MASAIKEGLLPANKNEIREKAHVEVSDYVLATANKIEEFALACLLAYGIYQLAMITSVLFFGLTCHVFIPIYFNMPVALMLIGISAVARSVREIYYEAHGRAEFRRKREIAEQQAVPANESSIVKA